MLILYTLCAIALVLTGAVLSGGFRVSLPKPSEDTMQDDLQALLGYQAQQNEEETL